MTLTETILGTAFSSTFLWAFISIKRKLQRSKEPDKNGVLPFSIYDRSKGGFFCVKCLNVGKNKKQYPICSCPEYHREHFHFKCNDCGFSALLKTADDDL